MVNTGIHTVVGQLRDSWVKHQEMDSLIGRLNMINPLNPTEVVHISQIGRAEYEFNVTGDTIAITLLSENFEPAHEDPNDLVHRVQQFLEPSTTVRVSIDTRIRTNRGFAYDVHRYVSNEMFSSINFVNGGWKIRVLNNKGCCRETNLDAHGELEIVHANGEPVNDIDYREHPYKHKWGKIGKGELRLSFPPQLKGYPEAMKLLFQAYGATNATSDFLSVEVKELPMDELTKHISIAERISNTVGFDYSNYFPHVFPLTFEIPLGKLKFSGVPLWWKLTSEHPSAVIEYYSKMLGDYTPHPKGFVGGYLERLYLKFPKDKIEKAASFLEGL